MDWQNRMNWSRSPHNTLWRLVGCAAGDFATIAFVEGKGIEMSLQALMGLAMLKGILTSILLVTLILLRQMDFGKALRTASRMSLVSMGAMELAMNAVDYFGNGGS